MPGDIVAAVANEHMSRPFLFLKISNQMLGNSRSNSMGVDFTAWNLLHFLGGEGGEPKAGADCLRGDFAGKDGPGQRPNHGPSLMLRKACMLPTNVQSSKSPLLLL